MSETEITAEKMPERDLPAHFLARLDRGALMRAAFVGVLLGAAAVLGMGLREVVDAGGGLLTGTQKHDVPVLPPALEAAPERREANDPRPFVTADRDKLRAPISFTLRPGGVLDALGTIDAGAADRLASELAASEGRVRRVRLNSPGGSLDDAIAMARMLRERGIGTAVENGAVCASSCPLLMAGGVTREAGRRAAIGLHQFYAAAETATDPAQAMADAQTTTARIARHLDAMGVDPAMWLHALDTPPQALYYLTPKEMLRYRLITDPAELAMR